jgi:hypothetical protein
MRARKIIHHERRAARPEAQRELRKTLKDFAGLANLCAGDMVMLVAQAEADPKKEDSVALAQLSVKDWQEAVAAAGYTFVGPGYSISTSSSSSGSIVKPAPK